MPYLEPLSNGFWWALHFFSATKVEAVSWYSWNHAGAALVKSTWAPASSAVWCSLAREEGGQPKKAAAEREAHLRSGWWDPKPLLQLELNPFPLFLMHAHSVIPSGICPTWRVSPAGLPRVPSGIPGQPSIRQISGGLSSNLGKGEGEGGGGGKAGAALAIIPQCLIKVWRRKCFISLMEMWVAGKGQKKRPGVRSSFILEENLYWSAME